MPDTPPHYVFTDSISQQRATFVDKQTSPMLAQAHWDKQLIQLFIAATLSIHKLYLIYTWSLTLDLTASTSILRVATVVRTHCIGRTIEQSGFIASALHIV